MFTSPSPKPYSRKLVETGTNHMLGSRRIVISHSELQIGIKNSSEERGGASNTVSNKSCEFVV